MAHEKGQAEVEAGITMRQVFFWSAYKKPDAMRCDSCGNVVRPGGPAGTWDFPNIYVPLWNERRAIYIDVEVKAGNTSLAWNRLEPDQHQWADAHSDRPKWLWICLGTHIGAARYPRRTVLMPYEVFLEIERQSTRKSLEYYNPALDAWDLMWLGKGLWEAPLLHPLRTKYRYL